MMLVPTSAQHDLRHVAATLTLTAGVDIKVVSEQLGHSTTQITRDIYLSVMPQVAHASAEATAAMVPRAVPTTVPDPGLTFRTSRGRFGPPLQRR